MKKPLLVAQAVEESKRAFWYRRKQEKKKDERKASEHVIYKKAIKMLSIIWQLYGCFYYREKKGSIHCLNFSLGIIEVIIT